MKYNEMQKNGLDVWKLSGKSNCLPPFIQLVQGAYPLKLVLSCWAFYIDVLEYYLFPTLRSKLLTHCLNVCKTQVNVKYLPKDIAQK